MTQPIRVIVNGQAREAVVSPRLTLLTFLREHLGLLGAKRGCEEGECGGCAVLLNGRLVDSCLVLAVEVDGQEVTTVEALGNPQSLSPLQAAFVRNDAAQCGFCSPGMLLAATALLENNPAPSEADIRAAISGTLCRCTGYDRIVRAIADTASGKEER